MPVTSTMKASHSQSVPSMARKSSAELDNSAHGVTVRAANRLMPVIHSTGSTSVISLRARLVRMK